MDTFDLLTKSVVLRFSSSFFMVILTAGWEMYSEAAALDMLLFLAAVAFDVYNKKNRR